MENSHHLSVPGLAVIRRLAESATYSAMVFALAPLEDSPQVKASHLECASFAGSQPKSSGAIDGLPLGRDVSSMPLERPGASEMMTDKNRMEQPLRPRAAQGRANENEEDVTPVRMVHRANPYADIPSLFDMYVQASTHQRPTERFGLEVFRNSVNDPEAIPMDLPVGPDYVVGPGDGLAIDLWGSVSQRLVRVVDREGRVSLPEAGPLLVSGQTLGEVQQSVQRALRTQFREVSADISLSRLRTVRVYVVGDVAAPGAYDISSLSTALNALFAAGGVTPRGSLRAVKHYRGKQLVETVDAYDLLLHGVRSDMRHLENGDTLLVPSAGPFHRTPGNGGRNGSAAGDLRVARRNFTWGRARAGRWNPADGDAAPY